MMFKKILATSILLLVTLLLVPSNASAKFPDRRTEKVTVIPKDVVLEDDFHVLYGEKVEVLGKVKGDLIVLAGDVLIK